jgi:hypothetical protein
MLENSSVAQRLAASQEGLCSIELVNGQRMLENGVEGKFLDLRGRK